ncbi:MAG: hypothetical protein M3O78_07980, partial [Chloroflexota bacterium]|nr:hypothetical protein [Chloroflexota bacterium]
IARSNADQGLPALGAVLPDAACSVLGSPPGRPGSIKRVRDLLGEQFVALLMVTGEEQAASAAVRASRLSWAAPCHVALLGAPRPLAGVTVLTDPRGELQRIFGGSGSYAFLVRPDGHLAARVPLPRAEAVDALPGLQARAIGA